MTRQVLCKPLGIAAPWNNRDAMLSTLLQEHQSGSLVMLRCNRLNSLMLEESRGIHLLIPSKLNEILRSERGLNDDGDLILSELGELLLDRVG